jgi:hypothetical protein
MAFGSPARAAEDSLKYVLKRRLPKLDPTDHQRYVELECHRIVETLRVVRDVYRSYLEKEGCKPIAEMYWVVFRFAVIQYAIKALRAAASDYITSSRVGPTEWQSLYGYSLAFPLDPSDRKRREEEIFQESVHNQIAGLVTEETLRPVMTGGPFGREGQVLLARSRPAAEFQIGQVTLMDSIELRQELWDKCRPWTEGLAALFDASQEELFCQSGALSEDGRRAELKLVSLSDFERIAYKHLLDMRQGKVNSRNLGEDAWLVLLRELDKQKVDLEAELRGKAKRVLAAVRRKGHKIESWERCYDANLRASLDDRKMYGLRRQITHSIHNAAKKAAYQLAKIWNS